MVQNRAVVTPFVRKSPTQTGVKEQHQLRGKGQVRQRSYESLWESVLTFSKTFTSRKPIH